MLTGNWIEEGNLNYLAVTIDGEKIPLEATVSQVERYDAQIKAKQAESAPSDFGGMKQVLIGALDLVEIILNPKPNEVRFTREQILEKIDLDQMNIIAMKWLNRKLFQNYNHEDPFLAPPQKGQK